MLKVFIGHSEDVDSADAIREVLQSIQTQMQGLVPQAGLLFLSSEYDDQIILDEIHKAFPELMLIGTNCSAQMSSQMEFREDSVVFTVFYSDSIEMAVGVGRNVSQDPYRAAQLAVDFAKSKLNSKPTLCITTPESMTVSGATLLNGLQSVLGKNFPIFGGTSSILNFSNQTKQYYRNEILTDSVPVLLLSGDILYSFGIDSGYTPLGDKRTVTKATSNTVYELDHEPILKVYKKYLGDIHLISPEYPLAIFEKEEDSFYLRTPREYAETENSIRFSGDIPVGSQVLFADGTRENLLEATKSAIQKAFDTYPGKHPTVAFVVSCATRLTTLGTRAKEEIQELQKLTPPSCQLFGLYVFGEITPLLPDHESKFLNASFFTLLIGTD